MARGVKTKAVAVVVAALALGACVPETVQGPWGPITCAEPNNAMPIMGQSCLSAQQLAAWYKASGHTAKLKGVTIDELAMTYLMEGHREGVRGDLAFVQAVVETGWFQYGGQVLWTQNNYAGIGATDGGAHGAIFSSPTIGVRAQIQHLRAYADWKASRQTLHASLVDPRFDLVVPKGKAQTVGGLATTWASSTWYSNTIVRLYDEAVAFNS
ncbi:MAG: glucosaminidase domain-containing protein [Acidimicrobiia bacterium]|nr:glucosaminidase domain-containing protein [Acidimicrobiia bacterium]